MLASKCLKNGLEVCLQNTHIAELWHRLPPSWQEGAVSPLMFLLSFQWGEISDSAWPFMQPAFLIEA